MGVAQDQTLPVRWLISDERNDAVLEQALRKLPRASGFIFRHYHLDDRARFDRFCALRDAARNRDHCIILADSALTAREWGADGIYGSPRSLCPKRAGLLHLATVHSMRELALANRFGASAALISPIFATRSHRGGAVLGPVRFRLLAQRAAMPVIALGGLDAHKARTLLRDMHCRNWAAIDGLS